MVVINQGTDTAAEELPEVRKKKPEIRVSGRGNDVPIETCRV